MARKVAKQTTKQVEEGVQAPSSSTYRLLKELKGNLNGKIIEHEAGAVVQLQPLEAFVFRDWLEKIQC